MIGARQELVTSQEGKERIGQLGIGLQPAWF